MIGWLAQSHSLPMQYLYLLVIVRIAADHGGRVGSRNEPAVGRPVPSARQRLCSPGRDCRPRDRRVTRAADSKVVRLFSCCSYWYVGVPLGVHPLFIAVMRAASLRLRSGERSPPLDSSAYLPFIAPEVLSDPGAPGTTAADVYMLAGCFLEVASTCRRHPFDWLSFDEMASYRRDTATHRVNCLEVWNLTEVSVPLTFQTLASLQPNLLPCGVWTWVSLSLDVVGCRSRWQGVSACVR